MSDIVWSDPEWLQYFPLNAATALDYFARSSFYDHACNNELIRQQGLDISRLPALPPGVEYQLHDMQEPHLYIVCKQQRQSPKNATPLNFYYILDGRIYQAPTLHATLSSRMGRCLWNIRAAFDKIQADIDPLKKIQLGSEGGMESQEAEEDPSLLQKQQTQEERDRVRQIDGVLHNVLKLHANLLPSQPPVDGKAPEDARMESRSPEQNAVSQPVQS